MEDTVTYHWKSSSNIRSDAAAVVAGSRRGGRGIPIHFDLKHDLIEFVRRGANVVKKTRRPQSEQIASRVSQSPWYVFP